MEPPRHKGHKVSAKKDCDPQILAGRRLPPKFGMRNWECIKAGRRYEVED